MTEIPNPIAQGDEVALPRGTAVRSTHPCRYEYVTTRRQTGTVRYPDPGYWVGSRAKLPQIEWVGGDGYHRHAQVTPELLRKNGISASVVIGETDQWTVGA